MQVERIVTTGPAGCCGMITGRTCGRQLRLADEASARRCSKLINRCEVTSFLSVTRLGLGTTPRPKSHNLRHEVP